MGDEKPAATTRCAWCERETYVAFPDLRAELAGTKAELERVREECKRRQMTNYDRAEAFNRIQAILHPRDIPPRGRG